MHSFYLCRAFSIVWIFSVFIFFSFVVPCHAAEPLNTADEEVVFINIRLVGLVEYPEQGITQATVDAQVADTLKAYNNRITLNAVKDVASRITTIYRQAGWVFTRAYVPAQESRDGVVEVHLLQGYLDAVDVYDNHEYRVEEIRAPFYAYLNRPVFSNNIEESVALVNDLPGMNVFGFYSVGSDPGSTRLNLRVRQEQSGSGSIRADNYGSDLTGKARLYADWNVYRLTDAPDQLKLGALKSFDPDNSSFGLFNYSRWLNGARDVVSVSAAGSDFTLGRGTQGTGALNISGESQTAFTQILHKFHRSARGNDQGYLRLSRARSNSDSNTFPGELNSTQRTWLLTAGYSIDSLDRLEGTWFGGNIDLNQGYYDKGPPVGQARDYSFINGNLGYRMRTDFIHLPHQIEFNWMWQYSGDITSVTDQFSLTGADRLRAFEPSLFSADTASIVSMNWYFPATDFFGQDRYMTTITPYWFMEYGYGVQNATIGNDQWAEMSDVGAGLSFNWKGGLSSKISVAKPAGSRISYDDENITATRVYIEVIWQID